jgi:hypothetical protein
MSPDFGYGGRVQFQTQESKMTNALKGKPLSADKFRLAEHSYRRWHLDLRTHRNTDNERLTLRDLLTRPEVWARQPNISVGDLIRIVDDGVDMEIKITAVGANGLLAEPFPKPLAGPAFKQLLAIEVAVSAEEDAAHSALTAMMLGAMQ